MGNEHSVLHSIPFLKMGNKHSSTSIVCLSGQSVGLRATESGKDVERRLAKAKLRKHNPNPEINEQRFSRKQLRRVAKHLRCPPDYFFTVDGNPTNLKVSQDDLIDSKFVAAVDNNEVKVHKLKDGDVPRRKRKGLDLEKIRDDAVRGCYDWNMGSETISHSTAEASSSSYPKRHGK